jgi:hypothetical protein
VREERTYEFGAGEESVEVAPGSAGSERVVGGVYKVRANLEGGDLLALRTEGGHEARGYNGLSDAGVGSRDYYTWDFYHSMPF